MATQFKLVGTHAVKILARLAARNAVKEQLRDQGVRVSLVPIRDISARTMFITGPAAATRTMSRRGDRSF